VSATGEAKPRRIGRSSMRAKLRAFQLARGAQEQTTLALDLETLRHADLDLSIKSGALLAFNGLIIAAGINPIAASPGAPLSVNAATDPWIVAATALGVFLMAIAGALSVGAILIGEDYDDRGLEHDPAAMLQRVHATYCAAIDAQARLLARAGWFTYAGGGVLGVAFLWALADKWVS